MPVPVALVLCGGGARRFGSDKTRADLGGRPLLDVLLGSLPGDWAVVCVGEARPTSREVTWTREEPPGGGPVAALAAGVAAMTGRTFWQMTRKKARPGADSSGIGPLVAVLGGDMPFAGPAAVRLVEVLELEPGARAATTRDGGGRVQPLLSAYRWEALRAALPADPVGARLTPLLTGLDPVVLDLPGASLDVDTPDDLEAARRAVERGRVEQ